MTVNFRTKPAIKVYAAPSNGEIETESEYDIDFYFLEIEDYLYVYLRKTDNKTVGLALDEDYFVNITDGTNGIYGTIVFKKSFENVSKICIRRNIIMDQPNKFSSQTLFSSTIEDSFDKITMMVQDHAIKEYLISAPEDGEEVISPASRFIHVQEYDEVKTDALLLPSISERANKFLKFDTHGRIQMADGTEGGVSLHIAVGDPSLSKPNVIDSFAMKQEDRANKLLGFDEDGAVKFQDPGSDFNDQLQAAVRLQDGEKFENTLSKEDIKSKILAFDENGEANCIENEFSNIKKDITNNANNIDNLTKTAIPEIENKINSVKNDLDKSLKSTDGFSKTIPNQADRQNKILAFDDEGNPTAIINNSTNISSDIESVKSKVEALQNNIDEVKSNVSTFESNINGVTTDLSQTKTQLTAAENSIESAKTRLTNTETRLTKAETSIKNAIIASDGFQGVLEGRENRANKYLKFNENGDPVSAEISMPDLSTCLRCGTGFKNLIPENRANKYLKFDVNGEPEVVSQNFQSSVAPPTTPHIYFVDKENGSDSNNGVSLEKPFATINKALEKIEDYQVDSILFIAPGEYEENLSFHILTDLSIHIFGANASLKGSIQTESWGTTYLNLAISGTIGTFSIESNINDVIINWNTDILEITSQSKISDLISGYLDTYYKFQLNINTRTFTLSNALNINISKHNSMIKISAEQATLKAKISISNPSLDTENMNYNFPLNIVFDFKILNVLLTNNMLFVLNLPKLVAFILKIKALHFYTNTTMPLLIVTSNPSNSYVFIDIDFNCSYFPDNITSLASIGSTSNAYISCNLGITPKKYSFTTNDKIKIIQSRWGL